MIQVTPAPPALSPDLSLYYAQDPLLEELPVLIFYGPSTTGNSTQNTSRIQVHIFSIAGFQSFSRLTIAPTSPLYAAVNHLPLDFQGDEVYRGLAVGLLSYFAALPNESKTSLRDLAGLRRPNGVAPMMFDEMHAGELASKMEQIEDSREVSSYLNTALSTQSISWLDMDVILPPGTIKRATKIEGNEKEQSFDESGLPLFEFGDFDYLIRMLGSPTFLPTSKLKRAPSRPTAHNKSRVLSKDAKIALRRELCEFVDTEKSYLDKLSELVNKIAVVFREKTSAESDALLPGSLDQILELSSSFYDEIQHNLDTTEDEAIRDIEGLSLNEPETGNRRRDPTGATDFAKALLLWFPKFLEPYQGYLRASNQFARIIGQASNDTSSPFTSCLNEVGEQRLRSFLIEPVQRLPRYSLLIDNMINLLPASHLSLSSFLKARDTINDICALDTSTNADDSKVSRTLSLIVRDWPFSQSPRGRLINAIDVAVLEPPFAPYGSGKAGMLLLFPEKLVLLHKLGDGALSARGFLAEMDRPAMRTSTDLFASAHDDRLLRVAEFFDLSYLLITESCNGRLAHMTRLAPAHQASAGILQIGQVGIKVFCLQGPYEGKAARFGEEVTKARIEGRYTEDIRESGKWALQTIHEADQLSIVAALSEHGPSRNCTHQKTRGQIRLTIGASSVAASDLLERDEQDTAMCINAQVATKDFTNYILTVESRTKSSHNVECTIESLVPSLLRQVGELCKKEHQQMIEYHTFNYRSLLDALPTRKPQEEIKNHSYRPYSPIKMLSKVFGSESTPSSTPSKPRRDAPVMKSLPSLPQPTSSSQQSTKLDLVPKGPGCKVTLVDTNPQTFKSPLALLEDTFMAYIVALRSRSGNMVGKILRNRAAADELTINELYNTLLEDPTRIQTAAEVSVDVLFAAFEKFLRRAWRERMGPLVAPVAVQNLQSSFDAGKPTIFAQDFKDILEEMSPQSRRCFAATVKLLLELLDASGNDGDRGVLIASFAEALILVGNPHEYINLLDRIVDDYDNLFDDTVERPGTSGSATGSLNGSLGRTRSFNTGSFSSNTSSLRRKFGLGGGLSRENSKNEPESKVASIWRTLSKSARSPGESHSQGNSQPGSVSKASLVRSRSTDVAPQLFLSLRPVSQDGPPSSGSRVSPEPRSRPGSSHNTLSVLSSIGEGTGTDKSAVSPKKKRRSSLSDLVKIQEIPASPSWSPLQPRKLPVAPDSTAKILPKTPSPRKPSLTKRFEKPSPPQSGLSQCFGSPQRKENSPLRGNSPSKENSPSPRTTQTKRYGVRPPGGVTITSYSPKRQRTPSRSNIPTTKGRLSERAWPANTNGTPPKKPPVPASDGPTRKLRLQSPQKIRERLSQEQKALAGIGTSLQDEINKISEEMSTYEFRASASTSRPTSSSSVKGSAPTLDALSNRLDTLSTTLQSFTATHTAATTALRTDLENSLQIADKKARKLDELYKEANAENEALYERFNDELAKILGRVKKGEGVEEMRERLAAALKEAAALRGDRAKLRREVGGLRSLVGE